MYPVVITAVIVILDQVIKYFVSANLMTGEITVIKNFFYLTYVENYGIAFGMFQNKTLFFLITQSVISIVIVLLIYRLYKVHFWVTVCLAMILGGALGNLIDRARLGYVVDYLRFTFFPPVFNLADSAIVAGAILLGAIVILDKNINI